MYKRICMGCTRVLWPECSSRRPDPCIGRLAKVTIDGVTLKVDDACCGHGAMCYAYVGNIQAHKWLRGQDALDYFIAHSHTLHTTLNRVTQ